MLIPVRCFTCNKVLGNMEGPMKNLREKGKTDEEIMKILKIERYCCKRILLTYIDNAEDMFEYQQMPEQIELYEGVKKLRIYNAI